MTIAFVLGNGQSRSTVDLNSLAKHGQIYGCNALYRDFTPTVLVATDAAISEAIQISQYALSNRFYTRRPIGNLGAQPIPQRWWKFSSGPVAAALAAEHGHQHIYLLGFDLGPTETGHFNNIYAGTEFYKKVAAVPTYTGNWINQLREVAQTFFTVQFVRVVGTTTAKITLLENISNLNHCPILEFQKSYK